MSTADEGITLKAMQVRREVIYTHEGVAGLLNESKSRARGLRRNTINKTTVRPQFDIVTIGYAFDGVYA